MVGFVVIFDFFEVIFFLVDTSWIINEINNPCFTHKNQVNVRYLITPSVKMILNNFEY